MPKLTANHLAALISVYFVVLGVLYSVNTPPFEGPDELAHFVYINKIITEQALPRIPDRETAFAERNYEVHQLPLYYIAGVPFAALFDRSDLENYFRLNPFASIGMSVGNNENVQLQPLTHEGGAVRGMWAVRLMSMALGVATLMTIYHSGRLLGGDAIGIGAILLAVSIPTFIHISASVNNDNLNTLMVSLAVYFPLRTWQRKQIYRWEMVVMAAALSAAAITKLTGLAAFAYVLGAHGLGWALGRFKRREIFELVGVIAGVFAVLVCLLCWRVGGTFAALCYMVTPLPMKPHCSYGDEATQACLCLKFGVFGNRSGWHWVILMYRGRHGLRPMRRQSRSWD